MPNRMFGTKSLMQRQRYQTGPHICRILLAPRYKVKSLRKYFLFEPGCGCKFALAPQVQVVQRPNACKMPGPLPCRRRPTAVKASSTTGGKCSPQVESGELWGVIGARPGP